MIRPDANAPITVAVDTELTTPNDWHALCKFAVKLPDDAAAAKLAEAAAKNIAGLAVITTMDNELSALYVDNIWINFLRFLRFLRLVCVNVVPSYLHVDGSIDKVLAVAVQIANSVCWSYGALLDTDSTISVLNCATGNVWTVGLGDG